eukprot:873539_1
MEIGLSHKSESKPWGNTIFDDTNMTDTIPNVPVNSKTCNTPNVVPLYHNTHASIRNEYFILCRSSSIITSTKCIETYMSALNRPGSKSTKHARFTDSMDADIIQTN